MKVLIKAHAVRDDGEPPCDAVVVDLDPATADRLARWVEAIHIFAKDNDVELGEVATYFAGPEVTPAATDEVYFADGPIDAELDDYRVGPEEDDEDDADDAPEADPPPVDPVAPDDEPPDEDEDDDAATVLDELLSDHDYAVLPDTAVLGAVDVGYPIDAVLIVNDDWVYWHLSQKYGDPGETAPITYWQLLAWAGRLPIAVPWRDLSNDAQAALRKKYPIATRDRIDGPLRGEKST